MYVYVNVCVCVFSKDQQTKGDYYKKILKQICGLLDPFGSLLVVFHEVIWLETPVVFSAEPLGKEAVQPQHAD